MCKELKEFLLLKYKESRALPGGMLKSKEKTEYEDWLESLTSKIDASKDKVKNEPVDYDSIACENGYHEWDGSIFEFKKRKEKELDFID